jgi:hypothetical protein
LLKISTTKVKDSGLGFNVRIYIYKKITKKLKKAIFEFGVGVWVGGIKPITSTVYRSKKLDSGTRLPLEKEIVRDKT